MISSSLLAHHSLAGVYDIRKQEQGEGVVQQVAFTNPHGAMHIEVKNPDGTATIWILTTGSANVLSNLEFGSNGPNTVKPGDAVNFTYYPARNGMLLGFLRSITPPNKNEVEFELN